MLPLLLLLVTAQAPAVPGETTLVSFCKQGRLSACDALAEVNPGLAAELRAELARSALRLAAQKAAEEEGGDQQNSEVSSSEDEASGKPPDCNGQEHHIISRPIARELEKHEILRGRYEPRDERFKTRAKDKESHCGYQKWHREVDEEVIQWLTDRPKATPEQFMKFLREVYNRPKMRKRFPNGF
ncbi:MAG TPA: Wall-associated protein precursor [Myxococcaceae bacterium]|jgi:hypothetical protein